MRRPIFEKAPDYPVRVAVCSLYSFLEVDPFSVKIDAEKMKKIDFILEQSKGVNFILFPEYTYSDVLRLKLQKYCDDNDCIIIAGSGLEKTPEDTFYAYCPVFSPNNELTKVYKKFITPSEKVYAANKIVPYPNETQRIIRLNANSLDDYCFTISVYVCYDFIQENKKERTDIIFVPQYEKSPHMFINEGDRISKGENCFVLGANNVDNNQRSLGFVGLNSTIINALSNKCWRPSSYNDGDKEKKFPYHHTIIYDTTGERILILDINLSKPYSLSHDYSVNETMPVVIPIKIIEIT